MLTTRLRTSSAKEPSRCQYTGYRDFTRPFSQNFTGLIFSAGIQRAFTAISGIVIPTMGFTGIALQLALPYLTIRLLLPLLAKLLENYNKHPWPNKGALIGSGFAICAGVGAASFATYSASSAAQWLAQSSQLSRFLIGSGVGEVVSRLVSCKKSEVGPAVEAMPNYAGARQRHDEDDHATLYSEDSEDDEDFNEAPVFPDENKPEPTKIQRCLDTIQKVTRPISQNYFGGLIFGLGMLELGVALTNLIILETPITSTMTMMLRIMMPYNGSQILGPLLQRGFENSKIEVPGLPVWIGGAFAAATAVTMAYTVKNHWIAQEGHPHDVLLGAIGGVVGKIAKDATKQIAKCYNNAKCCFFSKSAALAKDEDYKTLNNNVVNEDGDMSRAEGDDSIHSPQNSEGNSRTGSRPGSRTSSQANGQLSRSDSFTGGYSAPGSPGSVRY